MARTEIISTQPSMPFARGTAVGDACAGRKCTWQVTYDMVGRYRDYVHNQDHLHVPEYLTITAHDHFAILHDWAAWLHAKADHKLPPEVSLDMLRLMAETNRRLAR